MSTEMLAEMITAVGQHISDQLDSTKKWNPEANKYSRSFNPDLISDLIRTHLNKSEIYILFEMIKCMNSENKVGNKALKQLNLPRTTLFISMKKLNELGCIFEFPDGSIMLNPNIAMLSKYRKDCLVLRNIWNKQMKEMSKYNQEIEQDERLF